MTRNEWIISSVIVAAISALPIVVGYQLITGGIDHRYFLLYAPLAAIFSILGLVVIVISFFIKNNAYHKATTLGGLIAVFFPIISFGIAIELYKLLLNPTIIIIISLCLLITYLYYRRRQQS